MDIDRHKRPRLAHGKSPRRRGGYELPRTALRGGDPLRGGSGAGHAGRRSVSWAMGASLKASGALRTFAQGARHLVIVMALVVLAQVSNLMACAPTAALAEGGSDPRTVTMDGGTTSRHALDGQEAYCCNSYRNSPPNGTVLTNWSSGPLALDYVLYHSDGGPSDASPHYPWDVAKWVVWAIMEGDTSELDYYADGVTPNPTSALNHRLYDEAMAYQDAGGGGAEQGCSRVYAPPSDTDYQPIALCVPQTGRIELSKASALESVSGAGACYALDGAEFGVYRDEACDALVTTLVTDGEGYAASGSLAKGTYWVREVAAPCGYAADPTVYEVEVGAGAIAAVNGGPVRNAPVYAQVDALVCKADAVLSDLGEKGRPQGGATLGGARFAVTRYDNVLGSTEGQLDRSWVIETDSTGVARFTNDGIVAGDEPYRDADGNAVLPLGTYTVEEISAPEGYLLSDAEVRVFTVTQDGPEAVASVGTGEGAQVVPDDEAFLTFGDHVMRGGVRIGKVDAQRGDRVPQGAATLEGATIAVELEDGSPVVVGGTSYAVGDVILTLTTGADGVAQTERDALPYGNYVAYETEPSDGYVLTGRDKWASHFQIREDGQIVDLSGADSSLPQTVRRGDLRYVKVDGSSMARLSNVAFLVESLTTGERHVMVTDRNGYCSTESGFNAHSSNTNGNDRALVVDERGRTSVDEELLDASTGIWFSGGTDTEVAVDDRMGALPYDTYRVQELRSAANTGLDLVSFEVRITRDHHTVEGGTVSDQPSPRLATQLAVIGSAEGTQRLSLSDTVLLSNLRCDETEYEVRGTLHLVGDDGEDLGPLEGATATVTFVPASPSETVEVPLELDASELRGRSVVAFEELWCGGELVASHADIADPDQTVSIPQIRTRLTDQAEAKEVDGSSTVTLVDTVSYEGLTPGKAYALLGTLVDKETGSAIEDADGEPVTAQAFVMPESPSGTATVTFTFDGLPHRGKTLVAFETLLHEGIELAVHADIEDEAQAVTIPRVTTEAVDADDGDREVFASEKASIVDTVTYEGLEAGASYVAIATLVDHETGDPIQVGGKEVMREVPFVAEEPDGTIEVVFELDARELSGRCVTVFETLARDGRQVASHRDLASDEQTVRFPGIRTSAKAGDGSKALSASNKQTIVDTVSYEGLTPGKAYRASGVLHVRDADGRDLGPARDSDGSLISASAGFTPETSTGTVDVTFELDASGFAGKDLVVFELVLDARSGSTVATHEDISDEGQSVTVGRPPATPPDKGTKLPQTGDARVPMTALLLLLGAAGFAIGLGSYLRKKDDERRRTIHIRTRRARLLRQDRP